jgi:hypothetical protein
MKMWKFSPCRVTQSPYKEVLLRLHGPRCTVRYIVLLLSASALTAICAVERKVYLKLVSRFAPTDLTSHITYMIHWYLGCGRSNVRLTKQANNVVRNIEPPAHVRCDLLNRGHPVQYECDCAWRYRLQGVPEYKLSRFALRLTRQPLYMAHLCYYERDLDV